MSSPLLQMMAKYHCEDIKDYENALKQVLQELTLLALWRSKFFDKAAFYGGTALRILYGLDRFSEDMDFSLLTSDPSFQLSRYESAIEKELKGLGLSVRFQVKEKTAKTAIQSAFLKADTVTHLMDVHTPKNLLKGIHPESIIKIRVEIDIDPPGEFPTEFIELYEPYPFPVRTHKLPDLFAGKMHALLFREWKNRVKGRDWYDFVWYVGREVPLSLSQFEARLRQTGQLKVPLTKKSFLQMVDDKIERLNVDLAKEDVYPFIDDARKLDLWSKDFFHRTARKILFF